MYNAELIHQFLEGSLSKHQQDVLFMALSNNEEFRQELIDAIQIDKSFASRLSQMAPTSASTYSVFSKLGFTPPSPLMQAVKIPFYKKYFQSIITGISSVAVTSLVFILFIMNGTSNDNNYNIDGNSYLTAFKVPYPVMTSTDNGALADNSKGLEQDNNSNRVTAHLNSITNTAVEAAVTEDLAVNTVNPTNSEFTAIAPSEIKTANRDFSEDYKRFGLDSDNGMLQTSVLPEGSTSLDNAFEGFKGWGIEVKGSYYATKKETEKIPTQATEFSNMGLGLTYKMSNKLKLVLGIANQRFGQFYEGTDDMGNYTKYKQNTSYMNISAGLKYDVFEIDEYKLFVQGSAGILHNFTGGTGSLQLGVEYSPTPEFTFMVNAEYLELLFEHQNNVFTSSKFGFNYGVGFNF